MVTLGGVALGCMGCSTMKESGSHADLLPELKPYVNEVVSELGTVSAKRREVLDRIALHSGKQLRRLFVVGGGSKNEFLNRLTQEATGLEVVQGAAESSTVGNLAVQLAVLEGNRDAVTGACATEVSRWASVLVEAMEGN